MSLADRDLIAEGRERLSAATPTNWWHYGDIAHEIYPDSALASDHNVPPVAGIVERAEDAELIVWMRNSLPALLDAAEKLARVRAVLVHVRPICDRYSDDDAVSCGWKRAVVDIQHAIEVTE